jgi:hypothetical protein
MRNVLIAAACLLVVTSGGASADWRDACLYDALKTPAQLNSAWGEGQYLGENNGGWGGILLGYDFHDGTGAIVTFVDEQDTGRLVAVEADFGDMELPPDWKAMCREIRDCYWHQVCHKTRCRIEPDRGLVCD